MPLPADYVHHADLGKAARELLVNLDRLRLGGYVAAAFELACLLLEPGPWAIPRQGLNRQRLDYLLPALAWLERRDCPAFDGQPRRRLDELDRWARVTQAEAFASIVVADRVQSGDAGAEWTDAWLAALPESEQRDGSRAAIARFHDDVDWVLKARVRAALGITPRERIPAAVRALVPLRTAAPIRIAAAAQRYDHDTLLDVLLRCVEATGGAGQLAQRSLMLGVALDLHAGERVRAIARLKRWAAWLIDDAAIDWGLRLWPPYADLLRSRALAPALGLDDTVVGAYVAQCRQRGQRDAVDAAPLEWPAALQSYVACMTRLHADPARAEAAQEALDAQRPLSIALSARARRGEFTAPGADADTIAALEARVGLRLPPSYRAFLATSDGLYTGRGPSLLPANAVDWLRRTDPAALAAAEAHSAQRLPDRADASVRPRPLQSALQVSTNDQGVVLVLLPAVRHGAEWEAWRLTGDGVQCYPSFGALMRAVLYVSA